MQPELTRARFDLVETQALADLDAARRWPVARRRPGVEVRSGIVDHAGMRAYASRVALAATPDRVATYIADTMIDTLPEWNREFRRGELRRTLWSEPGDTAWLMQVEYATPPPLANREYVYGLRRRDLATGEVRIVYVSVDDGAAVPRGCVRATLTGTVHRVLPTAYGTCLEHLLLGDLGGAMPRWVQNHVLTGPILDANARDSVAQQRALGGARLEDA
jgi:hypothetical protein